ncbi:MAG: hypothetical protein QXW71_05170 [Thermoplasmata archaeon]
MNFLIAFDGSTGAVAASEFIKKFLKAGDQIFGLYVVTDTSIPIKVNLFEGTRTFDSIESFIFYLRDVFYAIFSGYNVKFSYTMHLWRCMSPLDARSMAMISASPGSPIPPSTPSSPPAVPGSPGAM